VQGDLDAVATVLDKEIRQLLYGITDEQQRNAVRQRISELLENPAEASTVTG
jgi:hypothetical protein